MSHINYSSAFYYKGKLVNNHQLSYDKNDFMVDTEFGPTWESFGSDNVILLDDDDTVCYFKWFVTGSNNKVYATKNGDIILNYNQIKNGKRLRKIDVV
jgi:hypothetical protein